MPTVEPHEAKQIHSLGHIFQNDDGSYKTRTIARYTGRPETTVRTTLKNGPKNEIETPSIEEINEIKSAIWRTCQAETFAAVLDTHKALAQRVKRDAENFESDARDLRHLTQAYDVNYKTLQLATGGVTSRTQQNQTRQVEHTVKVIEVPQKQQAAFRTTNGLKEIHAPVNLIDDTTDE